MSMQHDVALTWRLVSQGGGWRAAAALLGLVLMVAGMVAFMWFQSQPVVENIAWLSLALSVAGLAVWRTMLSSLGRR